MEPGLEAAEDRGERIALMEPLVLGEGSRHRPELTDVALDWPNAAPDSAGRCREACCLAGDARARDELLLQQSDRGARHAPRRH